MVTMITYGMVTLVNMITNSQQKQIINIVKKRVNHVYYFTISVLVKSTSLRTRYTAHSL